MDVFPASVLIATRATSASQYWSSLNFPAATENPNRELVVFVLLIQTSGVVSSALKGPYQTYAAPWPAPESPGLFFLLFGAPPSTSAYPSALKSPIATE